MLPLVKNKSLRKVILLQFATCLLLITLAAGVIFYLLHSSNHASDNVAMETAVSRMHVIVENVISQIKLLDTQKKEQYENKLARNKQMLLLYNGDIVVFLQAWLKVQTNGAESLPLNILITKNDGSVVFEHYVHPAVLEHFKIENTSQQSKPSPNNVMPGSAKATAAIPTTPTIKPRPQDAPISCQLEKDGLLISLFVPQDLIDAAVKSEIHSYIHSLQYGKNDYVWVNEVVNYQGGDNYAIRRIHPNLKTTEGSYLSTNLLDKAGAKPYESELAGIRDHGEILQAYYFKNLSDTNLARKYSFAKLYKPFNWIIATGTPEEDIYAVTDLVKQQQFLHVVLVLAITVLLILAIIGYGSLQVKENMELEIARNSAKSSLLSRASHDMRTPLNAIINFSGQELTKDLAPAELHTYLQNINKAAYYLLSLIDELLTMSKLEKDSLKLYPQSTQIISCLQLVEKMMRPRTKEKGQHFVLTYNGCTEADYVWIDGMRVQEILLNLLTNAVKFTPAGGTILCQLKCTAKNKDQLEAAFLVKDNGCGIPSELQNKIFEPFTQNINAEDATQRTGSGLGLSIVKGLVQLMHGQITLVSKPNQGSEFYVIFPWQRCVPPSQTIPPAVTTGNLIGKHVLICEDNKMNALILNKLLEKAGITSDLAENGQLGVEKFSAAPTGTYDLILMDMLMPVMDGLSATRAIRTLSRADAKTIPIIAVTANAYEEDREKVIAAGMNEHLSKPINPHKLYELLGKLIK